MTGQPTAVDTAYIAAAANRFSHVSDVCGSYVAYGTSTLLALWDAADISDRGTHETLPGHDGNVTAVRFITEAHIVTGDEAGSLVLWSKREGKWSMSLKKAAHGKTITTIAVYDNLVVTGASESLVKVWQLSLDGDSVELRELQTLPFKNRYPLALALTKLPDSEALILAIGGTDRNVQIWTKSEGDFVSSISLAGHEDWIRSLVFRQPEKEGETLVLASGSQDANVRLWNIEPHAKKPAAVTTATDSLSDELLDAFEASLGDLDDTEEGGRQISLKRHMLSVKTGTGSQQLFTVTFDALLVGHEAGITSLSWRPPSSRFAEPTLLSTSTDSSVILWSPSSVFGSQHGMTSLWINRQRFGDVGGQRLGGFVGGLWADNGNEVMAWGWSGGWRRWRRLPATEDQAIEEWTEVGAITGHNGPVTDLAWSPNGEYLASTSYDQTTRVHGEVSVPHHENLKSWHEIGRPQVHGYDLVGVAFIDSLHFVSIADEKVARVFEAPQEFVNIVQNLHVADLQEHAESRPRAATVPPLGLSNKAVTDASTAAAFQLGDSKRRPFEGELAAFTLWPEIEKVFGHGYESITLAVSNKRDIAATACKATTAEHAVVRLHETSKWQTVGQPLAGHTLTVTGVAFSPDDKYVLTVSRDRYWRLFERKEDGFVPVAAEKAHARIIWDCAWAHEGDVFVTAARDKTVKIWHISGLSGSKWTPQATINVPEAATAVALAPVDSDQRRRMAIGLESGEILIYSNSVSTPSEWTADFTIAKGVAHVGQVHRVAWRPQSGGKIRQLASCSEDGTMKVLDVRFGTD